MKILYFCSGLYTIYFNAHVGKGGRPPPNDIKGGVSETLKTALKSIHWKVALTLQVQLLFSTWNRVFPYYFLKDMGYSFFRGLNPLTPITLLFLISNGTSKQAMTGSYGPLPIVDFLVTLLGPHPFLLPQIWDPGYATDVC